MIRTKFVYPFQVELTKVVMNWPPLTLFPPAFGLSNNVWSIVTESPYDILFVHTCIHAQIHGVRIKAGNKATYTNRYVRTKKLAEEEKAGKPLQLK